MAELQVDSFSDAENVLTDYLPHICDAMAASNSVSTFQASYIAGLFNLVSLFEKFPALFPAWSISSGWDTNWANLGIYEMRFDDVLGHPEFVRLPYTELDSASIILPHKKGRYQQGPLGDIIEVIVMLRKYDLQALQEDSLWRKLACD